MLAKIQNNRLITPELKSI